jgi:hypothetical protein
VAVVHESIFLIGRSRYGAASQKYIDILGRDHGEHHAILRDFLNSNWTDDEELWTQVLGLFQAGYAHGILTVSIKPDSKANIYISTVMTPA